MLLAVAVTLGCKPPPEGPMPICLDEVAGSEAEEVQSQDIPGPVWFGVVLRNFNGRTMEVVRPTTDCSGKSLEPEDEEIKLCLDERAPGKALPARALDDEDDLTITPLDTGGALVWVRTEYYESGEAIGPVAIAEFTKKGIAIRAIGPLLAHPDRIRMRLELMGETRVLVAESNVCPDPEDRKSCYRQTRLVPIVRERFVRRPLLSDGGECLGPAVFDGVQSTEVDLRGGMRRRFELRRSFEFEEGNVIVAEEVKIEDYDPASPDLPAKPFRQARLERPMVLGEGGLVTKEGLWAGLLEEAGAVRLEETPPADAG